MTTRTCAVCNLRPPIDRTAQLCNHCLDQLTAALGDVAALTARTSSRFDYTGSITDDLDVLRTGQHVIPPSTRISDTELGETPQQRAGRLQRELHQVLAATIYAAGWIPPDAHPRPARTRDDRCDIAWTTTARANATELLRHAHDLAHRPDTPLLWQQITDVVARTRSTIDRPADRWFAGPCYANCGADLWAKPNSARVQCTACGWTYDVTDLRNHLLEKAGDQLANAALICRVLTTLDMPITVQKLSVWKQRGRISEHPPHPRDPHHRPRYRVGDVIDLLDAAAERAKTHVS